MILKRYINIEILKTTGAILLVLILIFISTRFIKYIQLAVDGSISSSAMFQLLWLQIPAVAGFLIPLSFFMAILLTFGRLYSENEMAVIQSVGVSELSLVKGIFPLALSLALISGTLSFWTTPWSSVQSNSLLAQEKAVASLGAFSPGHFRENPKKTGVVFVESKNDKGEIRKLFAVSGLNSEDADLQIQTASTGRLSRENEKIQSHKSSSASKDQDFLILENGKNFTYDNVSKQWRITQYETYFMRIEPPKVESSELVLNAKSTLHLLQNAQANEWAELHWRLSAPLSIVILCFLAVPLARTQPRSGKFSRVLPAIMVYIAYALLLMNGRRLIESGKIPVELGFWWIHLIAILTCVWLFRPIKVAKQQKGNSNV